MARVPSLVRRGMEQISDVRTLEMQLREDPTMFDNAFLQPLRRKGFESMGLEEPAIESPMIEPAAVIGSATSALEKIRVDGEAADLTPSEVAGFEAIILIAGRPAIIIQDGRFFPPPSEWKHLEHARTEIETVCQSVGRIEVDGHPGGLTWVGTGVLVGDGVLMSNRHVAKEFCAWNGAGKWGFERGMKARVDYCEELGAAVPHEFEIDDVIGVHDVFDLALFRVASTSATNQAAPKPLPISAKAPRSAGGDVYVVGYPASDSRRNDPDVMRRLFSNIFDVKRLQPGKLKRLGAGTSIFEHDCSTLGGNSGSGVFDLATGLLVGLHFMGRYLEYNRAVALWELRNDPLLTSAGVQFA